VGAPSARLQTLLDAIARRLREASNLECVALRPGVFLTFIS
jgi:hypothetical protein